MKIEYGLIIIMERIFLDLIQQTGMKQYLTFILMPMVAFMVALTQNIHLAM